MLNTPSKMEKAMVQITLDHPFFADVLCKYPVTARTDIPTLAVNRRGQIFYNHDFVEALPVPQIIWGVCHEILHVVDLHGLRMGSRDPRAWNIAGDAWINDTLDASGIGQRIPNCINMPGSKDKTVEEIYDGFPQDGGSLGRSPGGQGGQPSDEGIGDDLLDEGEPLSEAEAKEIAAQIMMDIAQASQSAKMRGDMPAALQKFIAERLEVKTPWYEHLEKYMVGMTSQDYKWSHPSRRYISQGLYLPSIQPEPSMGEMVIQVDISGSVSEREIAYYNGHMQRIVDQCHPAKVHVIYTDTDVQHHDEFLPEDYPIEIGYRSGGGTDMRKGFEFIEQLGIEPDVVVTLTDGYTPFPESTNCPAVWCISSDTESPTGETIHFEMV